MLYILAVLLPGVWLVCLGLGMALVLLGMLCKKRTWMLPVGSALLAFTVASWKQYLQSHKGPVGKRRFLKKGEVTV